MSHVRRLLMLSVFALLITLGNSIASAEEVKTVFVIAMENHNWTQPANQFNGGIQQIFQNPAAPFINSLVNGTAVAKVDGRDVRISEQVSFATNYHNVLATANGNNPHIHPSEPNYLWSEAGTNFGILNDNDPFSAVNPSNQNTTQHLVTLLTKAGRTWRSYQEDTDLTTVNGQLTNVPLPRNQWTVPLKSASGVFAAGNFNQFNGSNQFNYAAKHNPQVFFTDSNGGNDTTTANPLSQQYAPLQQFYKENGVIIIWFDESEQDGVAGDNPDDFNHTVGEIVISKHARKNVNGVPYASTVNLTHSSDLRTMQEIFHLSGPFLGDAANSADLSDLFQEGAIPGSENEREADND